LNIIERGFFKVSELGFEGRLAIGLMVAWLKGRWFYPQPNS